MKSKEEIIQENDSENDNENEYELDFDEYEKKNKKKLLYNDNTYNEYLLKLKRGEFYQHHPLHEIIKFNDKNNYTNTNHVLSYVAMQKRILDIDKEIQLNFDYYSTVHEYFLNMCNPKQVNDLHPNEWKIKPTFLIKDNANEIMNEYLRCKCTIELLEEAKLKNEKDIINNEKYYKELMNESENSEEEDEDEELNWDEETNLISKEKTIWDKKYLKDLKMIFLQLLNEKCITNKEKLIRILERLINQFVIYHNKPISKYKLKNEMIQIFQLL